MHTRLIAIAAVALGVSCGPATAQEFPITIDQVTAKIVRKTGEVILEAVYRQLFDDNRSAFALAETPKGGRADVIAITNWFGDTGLVQAISEDLETPATAGAAARNKLRGKVVYAKAIGAGAFAYSEISWKGDAKFTATDIVPPATQPAVGNTLFPTNFATVLPEPDEVLSATITFDWLLDQTDVDATSNATGGFDVDLTMNGVSAFSGGVSYDHRKDSGALAFDGDLVALSGQFADTSLAITAPALSISGATTVPFDYQSFFDTGDISVDIAGRMTAQVASVPLPAGLPMLVVSVVLLLGLRRRTPVGNARGMAG